MGAYLTRCVWKHSNRDSDHDVRQTLQTESSQHQNSTTGSFNQPECTCRRNHVRSCIASCKNSGHKVAETNIVHQDNREIIVQCINPTELLHKLSSASKKQSLQVTGSIPASKYMSQRDLRLSFNLKSSGDRKIFALNSRIINWKVFAAVATNGFQSFIHSSSHDQPSWAVRDPRE